MTATPGPADDLPRGVRAQRRAGPGRPPGRGAARADPDRVRHPGAAAPVPAADRGRRRSCGARATPSRAPAPTWRRCPPPPRLDGDEWVITGQKVWTSLAHVADWCFVLARTEPGSRRAAGLSYLLVPMRQPGVTVRPIRQLTGTSEFNEVFFDGARTEPGHVVGRARGRLAGGRWPRWQSSAGRPRSASRSASGGELDEPVAAGPADRRGRRSAAAGPARPGLDRPGGACTRTRCARWRRKRRRGRAAAAPRRGGASVLKLLWSRWHQRARRARDGGARGRPPWWPDGAALRPRRVAAAVPVQPG